MTRNLRPTSRIWLRLQRFARDTRGLAAVEFAFVLPVMMVLFFGTIEFCSGIAVSRKVTLMARTLSDLTSQSTAVANSDLTNFFNASIGIMTPYSATPANMTISELFVDPTTLVARVQWSQGSAPRATSSTVQIPGALQVGGTYLIFSEVNYKYVPTVGWVMAKAGITLSDVGYTRPRQSVCVYYTGNAATASSCTKL
ncbi:pilus assembly protein [Bradyrhizobium jicamae]|uniref:Pilus assembly protein n=1 Tax=Bradyrhizobium jicamae TaxID=280332 RepID=A0ABS5FMB6_9BRAD|nr:TadE/TadG family type IV pilus assembly protein [Bradyrhizobium jicamae]MBR0797799.1 pilus assembly protein [Bradyrhizobium jicamae]MBR0936005.1 pilus assembly protein [Bradyrhizobium jicamae]